MKIDEQESFKPLEKDSVIEERKVQQEYTYKGSKRRIPGLILWEFDTKTRILEEAPMEKIVMVSIDGKTKNKMSVIYKPYGIYHQAHNRKAAVRKFNLLFENMKLDFRIEK